MPARAKAQLGESCKPVLTVLRAFTELLGRIQPTSTASASRATHISTTGSPSPKKDRGHSPAALKHTIQVWCAEFDTSADDGDMRRDALPSKRRGDKQRGEKFLEGSMTLKPIVHEIQIQSQVIFLDPPLALSSKLGANARYSHVGNAVQITARNSLTTRCNGRSRSWRPRSEDYISKWLQFQSLRDLEANYVFNRLGDLLAHLEQQLTGIKRARAVRHDRDRMYLYDAWLRDILLRFGVKLGNAMKEIHAAIPKARNGSEHHPIEGLAGGKRRFCSFGFRVSRPARPYFPTFVLILYALPFLPALSLASVAI
ncbi:hypothetical protein BC834DRAFT_846701 [Gloeopeniophorella convolvens]|nr:hypothetical protein BC834DRAFT_846701 [Gloeopeniophorella convolvens]